ncbi:MAG: hypothetical protein AAGK09_00095 [Planctomycetota bacterium]
MTSVGRDELVRRHAVAASNTFLKLGGWRYADALYLIGGFARGEGLARIERGRLEVLNDIDLLAVVGRPSLRRLIGLTALIRRWKRLAQGGVIDLVVKSKADVLAEPRTIAHADLRHDHCWLWGKPILALTPRAESFCLDRGDALQLLMNRQASLMHGILALSDADNHDWVRVQVAKPLFAAMAAALVFTDAYHPSLLEQRRRIDTIPSGPLSPLLRQDVFLRHLDESMRFRADPAAVHAAATQESLHEVGVWYCQFVRASMSMHYGQAADAPLDVLIRAMRSRQPRQFDLRLLGWWACWRGGHARWPRVDVHPLVDVYAAHLRWMSAWLQQPQSADRRQLGRLLDRWSFSAYGCRLR